MSIGKRIKIPLWQKTILIIFGLFLTLVVLEVGLRLGGGLILFLQERRNLLFLGQKGECRIVCFGESTTQGQYPLFLEEALNRRKIGIKFIVIDKGIPGTNTGFITSQLEASIDKYQPDIVVTMMGTNDFGIHMPYEADLMMQRRSPLKSLRIYKLMRFLQLHIITKAKESGFYKARDDNWSVQRLRHNLQKVGLKTAYIQQSILVNQEINSKKALESNPANDWAYVGLGWVYVNQGKPAEAETAFKKALESNPANDWAYVGLGWVYVNQGKPAEAETAFKKALESNPANDWAYVGLGWLYIYRGRTLEAETAFKKALESNPANDWAYVGLGWLYIYLGRPLEAEETFSKTLEPDSVKGYAYASLGALYADMAGYNNTDKAMRIRERFYNPVTINNYYRFKQIIDRRKIIWVCAQYPMRSIEPLKKMFRGDGKGVIFVDNERIFKDAVAAHGYQNYFKDMFGGEFGHCTTEGNRLLAENIADVILRECFHK
ncbi:MAG: tetratricopeptide repeat protein [Candidatus Omnitrophota bacterium]